MKDRKSILKYKKIYFEIFSNRVQALPRTYFYKKCPKMLKDSNHRLQLT